MLSTMATLTQAESRRLYSWWWDSHISPKNSKWLQENLTDMDTKVNSMIKLIEEDADSFARRAEMYYKKRPELMKLVEEFYRAYRALAERYDHATRALSQAHQTMAEAFPNQVPFALTDDSPSGSSTTEGEPRTPEMPPPIRAFIEPDDLQKDALGQSSHFHSIKRSGACSEEKDALNNKRGLKQVNEMFASGQTTSQPKFAEGKVRKVLNFHEEEGKTPECKTHNGSIDIQKKEKGGSHDYHEKARLLEDEVSQLSSENQNLKMQITSEHDHVAKCENEILRLRESLSKSKADKDVALLQCQESLDKVSDLEMTISRTHDGNRKLIKLAKLESAEGRCLVLEREKQDLEIEVKDLIRQTNQHQRELQQKQDEMDKLRHFLQEERIRYAQADAALQSLEKLHSQSLEKLSITALELQSVVEKLKNMELRNCSLEEDIQQVKVLNSNLNKVITLKEEELKKLNISIQYERSLSVQAQEVLQTTQSLHSQSQEEIRILMLDVQSKVGMLQDMELKKHHLEEEIQQLIKTNGNLNDQVSSSALMIRSLQEEIFNLKETQVKLENEVEHHLCENETLQQELHCLQEENADSGLKHQCLLEQIEAVGLNKESFQVSVRELQDGNLELKELCKIHEDEKAILINKLENMEKVIEKNTLLETSLSDATAELEGLREKVNSLEESCESLNRRILDLTSENGSLVSQLESATKNIQKLSENNTFLENSLSDANVELEVLRGKLKTLEESSQSVYNEHSNLLSEKIALVTQIENIGTALDNMNKSCAELEDKHLYLEREKESTLVLVSELQNLLKLEQQEREAFALSSNTQLATLEGQMNLLKEDNQRKDKRLEGLQHKLLNCEIQSFILQRCLFDSKQWHEDHLASLKHMEKVLSDQINLLHQEHEAFVLSSNTQLATLADQICLLQEEIQGKDEKLEGLHHKLLNCGIQAFIFQKCLVDSNDWSQKHLASSICIEKALSDMKQENLGQKKMIEYISDHNKKLQEGIQMVLTSSGIDHTCRSYETKDEPHFQHILGKMKEVQNFIGNIIDENHVLLLEKLVIITVLQQLGLDLAVLKLEKEALNQEFEIGTRQLLALNNEKHELLQINENLRQFVHAGCLREDKLKAETDLLGKQLLDLQGSHKKSQAEICILIEENQLLTNEISHLRDEKQVLEEENRVIFAEAMNLSFLSSIFEQFSAERAIDVRNCSTDLDSLHLREDKLKAEMDLLDKQLFDLQESHKKSQAGISILIEENQSLTNEVSNLRDEIKMLEQEHSVIFAEAMNLSCLSLIFEQFGAERVMNLRIFSTDLDFLHGVNNALENKVIGMAQKIELIEAENVLLKDSAVKLEDCQGHLVMLQDDLNMARNVHEQLNHQIDQLSHQIETGNSLLTQKDFELTEANKKLKDRESENISLYRDLEATKMEFDELMAVRKELEKKICMLIDGNSRKDNEIANIRGANQMLNAVLQNVRNEVVDLRASKEHLASELTYEIKLYEDEVARRWNESQISTVHVEIFEEKMLELIGECESLEISAIIQRKMLEEHISANYTYADQLNQKHNSLERESRTLKSKLNSCLPLMLSLQNSIASLENQTLSLIKHHELNDLSAQDASLIRLEHVKSFRQLSADLSVTELDGIMGLEKLQLRIEELQKVLEYGSLLIPESDVNAKSSAMEMGIEVSKQEKTLGEEVEANKNAMIQLEAEVQELSKDVELQPGGAESSKGGYGPMMKDIQLDQSSFDNSSGQYKKVGAEDPETDDQMLKLWETAESDCNNEMLRVSSITATDDIDYHQIEAVEEEKSEYPSQLVAEKELGVDKLGMSKKVNTCQEWNNRLQELLASDAQRLSILQNSVQELKKQLEKSEKIDPSTKMKYDTMKGQLKRAEEAILELVDVNTNLTKKAEDGPASFDIKVGEQEEARNQQKRQVSDHVQKLSEKIGRLELELQKIQYVLLKLDEECENRVRAAQGRSRVILRDFLYGRREGYRRKGSHFCGCIRPKTSGD